MSKHERYNERQEMSPEQKELYIRKLGYGAMNCHHIIWMAHDHHDPVRAMQILQPQMYMPAHNALHQECPPVPKFTPKLIETIRADFRPTEDTLDSLDRLLFLINGVDSSVIKGFIKDMCLHSLESQIPFLKGNIKPAIGYHK